MTEIAFTPWWKSPTQSKRYLWPEESDKFGEAAKQPPSTHQRKAGKAGYVTEQLSEALDSVTIQDQVLSVLAKTESEWRSVRSIAHELGLSESRVRRALHSLGDEVRQPIAARPSETELYRLSARGLAPRERFRYILLVLAQQGR